MNVVVLAWNISLLPEEELDDAIASFISKAAARNGCQADDPNLKALENDIRALIIRKKEEYPTIGKFFYQAEVFDDGGQIKSHCDYMIAVCQQKLGVNEDVAVSKPAKEKSDKKKPSWSDIKKAIAGYDRAALVGLISDLYASSAQNKTFLHARFSTGSDSLKPYLKIIEDTLYSDVYKNKPLQISKAKKAISDYTKASGEPKGILELMVFFVETGTKFIVNSRDMDGVLYLALVRMYDKALDLVLTMNEETIGEYYNRFEDLVTSTSNIGWGYHDALEEMFHNAFPEDVE